VGMLLSLPLLLRVEPNLNLYLLRRGAEMGAYAFAMGGAGSSAMR
jgi:hypothetical protein